jgi:hypothetical protein
MSGQCAVGPTLADGTPCPDADPCNGTETCQAGSCTTASGPAALGAGMVAIRGATLAMSGVIAPAGPIAPSTSDALTLTIDAGGTALFASTLGHPGADVFWVRSKPPILFKYKDGGGGAGGLTQLQMKQRDGGYSLKAKGRSDQLLALQGGAVAAKLVVGNQCWVATLPCVKKGHGLRCAS